MTASLVERISSTRVPGFSSKFAGIKVSGSSSEPREGELTVERSFQDIGDSCSFSTRSIVTLLGGSLPRR